MNTIETATVLALAAAYDQRTVGDADIRAWQHVLRDVAVEPAMDAVNAWYRDHRERIMPADVRRGAMTNPAHRTVADVLAEQQSISYHGNDDPATKACQTWIRAYRSPKERGLDSRPAQPSMRFAMHLGRHAGKQQDDGVHEVAMLREFSKAGFAGVCVCGKSPFEPEFQPDIEEKKS